MVRSQTRPPEPPASAPPEPEPLSGAFLLAVYNSLWKKEEPEVIIKSPTPEPAPPLEPAVIYQAPQVHVTVNVPRRLLYAIMGLQAVILCLQVAHLVSP